MYVLQLLYQLAFDQFLGQRDHPHGIKSAEEYIAAIGYCEYVPVGQMVRRVLQKDSHLLLAPWHPNLAACDKSNLPPQLRSLMRPHTLLADVCHEITPAMRSRLQPKIEAKEPDFFAYGNRFIIPFGDMYKFEAVGRALYKAVKGGSPDIGVDFNQFLRDAAAARDGFIPHQVRKYRIPGMEPVESDK